MTGRVAGTVRAAGRPLDDAVLTLTDGAGRQVARVVETPGGMFALDGLPPGRYVLIAHHSGHRPRATGVRVPADGTVTPALTLELEPLAGVRGVVRDPDTGRPVAAATIVALDAYGDVVATTISDLDGTYRLGGVDAAITLVVAAPGADPVARGIGRDPSPTGADQVVDLPVRTLGTLAGTVTAGGTTVAGLTLELHDEAGDHVGTATTDAEGGYRFDGLPAGRYTVRSATGGAQVVVAGHDGVAPDVFLTTPGP